MSRGVKARTPKNSRRKPESACTGIWQGFLVPATFDDIACEEFERLRSTLQALGTIDRTDPRIVATAADHYSTIARAKAEMAGKALTLETANGTFMPHPMLKIIATYSAHLRGLLNDMGLTPKAAKMTGNSQPEAAGSDGWDGILNVAS